MQRLRFALHGDHPSLEQTTSLTPAYNVVQTHVDMFRTNVCPLKSDTEPITTDLINRQAGVASTIPTPININRQQTTLGPTHT